MGRDETRYVYLDDSTGTCSTPSSETADPDALASRMRSYLLVCSTPAGPGLADQMARDQAFLEQVEAGWADLEQGRVSSMDAVKRRLGDL